MEEHMKAYTLALALLLSACASEAGPEVSTPTPAPHTAPDESSDENPGHAKRPCDDAYTVVLIGGKAVHMPYHCIDWDGTRDWGDPLPRIQLPAERPAIR